MELLEVSFAQSPGLVVDNVGMAEITDRQVVALLPRP